MSHGGRMQDTEEELWRLKHPNGREPNVPPELAEQRRLVREQVWAKAKEDKKK